ncbi:MAG TPA: ABC transporter permease [Actinomycetota bacterium]|jgi:ABC-2 type transport system permease protein|nr:ABC transporter permease [Actinomycetota bacterium]
MWAMVVKEFRQLRRDRRTVALLIVMPLLQLIVFGYAASFDVSEIPTAVLGPGAERVESNLPDLFRVVEVDQSAGPARGRELLRNGDAVVAVVAEPDEPVALIDGAELFSAQAALEATARAAQRGVEIRTEVLFNPDLETSAIMIPGLAGVILLFIGSLITSLGVVREREAGTLEQLAVMPLRPRDVVVGKIAPYFVVAAIDMVVILVAGVLIFDVPFNGSVGTLALGSVLFLFTALGIGVLISSVSQSQGEAIQLALLLLLPQFLLSGLIFPLSSMAAGVRWIGYALPLTWFIEIARGVMIRGASLHAVAEPMLYLAAIGAVVFLLALLRFRRELAPAGREERVELEPALR